MYIYSVGYLKKQFILPLGEDSFLAKAAWLVDLSVVISKLGLHLQMDH